MCMTWEENNQFIFNRLKNNDSWADIVYDYSHEYFEWYAEKYGKTAEEVSPYIDNWVNGYVKMTLKEENNIITKWSVGNLIVSTHNLDNIDNVSPWRHGSKLLRILIKYIEGDSELRYRLDELAIKSGKFDHNYLTV